MRVKVNKFLFFGDADERDAFFSEAQKAGIIEFIDREQRYHEASALAQKLATAHKILTGLPVVEQEEDVPLERAEQIADQILDLRHRDEQLREERRMLRQEIARTEVFGNFSHDDITFIEKEGGLTARFFAAKTSVDHNAEEMPGMFKVGTAHGLDYYVCWQEEVSEVPEAMIEMRLERPLKEMQDRLQAVKQEISKGDDELKSLARFDSLLQQAVVAELNNHSLQTSKELTTAELDSRFFSVSGWVPEDSLEQMQRLIAKHKVVVEQVAVDDDDKVPTHLLNSGVSRIGEDLVNIYDTPAVEDKDPSPWVFWAFALFFAIIVGDGGYGLLFLLTGVFLGFKFPKVNAGGRRAIKLLKILGVSCLLWGMATGSFFGINLDYNSPWRQFSVLHYMAAEKAEYHITQGDQVYTDWSQKFPAIAGAEDGNAALEMAMEVDDKGKESFTMMNEFYDNILLELALFVGTLHIILGLIRYADKSWANVGWVLFLVGGYLYVPEYLQATSLLHFMFGWDKAITAETGMHLMQAGFGGALALAIIQNKLMGVLEIANLIQVFADVLSYLRLYALALAGAIVSATINEIAGSVALVFGVVLIILGHAVNIILSIMGGVIHGLRLNFIEWYHYCFDGGGKQFSPLRLFKID